MVKIIKNKIKNQEVAGGNQIKEKYSSIYPWIRYNFEYDPFQKNTVETPQVENALQNLNSLGYACDDFKTIHDGKHILFNGCSQTYGYGIEHDENWTTKVYDHISKHFKTSGYYNIAYPARGIHNIIFETIKYCETYGSPDYIFICFPDIHRFFGTSTEDKLNKQYTLTTKVASEEDLNLFYDWAKPTIFQYYYMLEKYCELKNIKLFSFSWQLETEEMFKEFNFKSFYFPDEPRKYHYIQDYHIKNPNDPYYLIARDDCHLGTGWHSYSGLVMSEEFDSFISS